MTQLLIAFVFSTRALRHEFSSAADKDLVRRVVGGYSKRGEATHHKGNCNLPDLNFSTGQLVLCRLRDHMAAFRCQ